MPKLRNSIRKKAKAEESFEAHAEMPETDMIAKSDEHAVEQQTQPEQIESNQPGDAVAEKQDAHPQEEKRCVS